MKQLVFSIGLLSAVASAVLSAQQLTAPTLTKSFTPGTIAPGGTSTLSFTFTNPAAATVTGLAFTDSLPAGVTVANGLTFGACAATSGLLTADVGSSTVSIAGIAMPSGGSCTFSLPVIGATEGIKNNLTSTLTSTNALPGAAAAATLTVISAATISKSFGEVSIVPNGTVRLTFSISNPNATLGLTGVGVTDTLPAGLLVNNPALASTTCTPGTLTALAGTNAISLAGGTLAAGATCTATVFVQAGAGELGLLTNVSGPVLSNAGPGLTATASVFVGDPFQVTYMANLNLADNVINITNSGARGAGLASGVSASTTGAICANIYAFSPDEQLLACCSCPVTPNGLVSLSGRTDLIFTTLTLSRPTSLVLKILATVPAGGSCINSAAAVGTLALASGLVPFSSRVHTMGTSVGGDGGSAPGITETPFSPADLSAGELSRLGNLCNFLLANGSGFGICRTCRLGGLGADKL